MKRNHETLRLERVDAHVLRVTLDRPELANAMNTRMACELRDLWASLYVDDDDLRCVVLTGAGERASARAAISRSVPP